MTPHRHCLCHVMFYFLARKFCKMADARNGERTSVEVESVLTRARVDANEMNGVTQTLYYGKEFVDNDLILMEIDEDLLNIVINNESLIFRGKEDDEVVLCADNRTYSVKEAETSNSLLLLPDLRTNGNSEKDSGSKAIISQNIIGTFHSYLELTEIKPGLHRLYSFLEENLYEGPLFESEKLSNKYTFKDLLDVIQASENELKSGLKEMEAYEIDGYWRVLEFDYQSRVVMHIVNFIQENSWKFDSVKKQDILNILQELEPKSVLEQCLNYFSIDTEKISEDGQNILQVKEDKICRFFAEIILRQAGKFDLKEFLESWRLSVPEGCKTDLKQLDGMVLIEKDRYPQTISRLTIWDLPESIDERFKSLFKIRQKWRCEDIKPFIMDFTSAKITVDSLLTKYSRISISNNERYCNAKY